MLSPAFSADILKEILLKEQELLPPGILGDEEQEKEEEEEEEDLETNGHCVERDSLISTSSMASQDSTLSLFSSQVSGATIPHLTSFVSGLSDGLDSGYVEDNEENSYEGLKKPGSQEYKSHRRSGQKFNKIYKLFKSTSQLVLRKDSRDLEASSYTGHTIRRVGSLSSPLDSPSLYSSRTQRSRSLPQSKLNSQLPKWLLAPSLGHQRRRPFLSGDEDPKASTLRIVVFGSDQISGKVARAYSNLR